MFSYESELARWENNYLGIAVNPKPSFWGKSLSRLSAGSHRIWVPKNLLLVLRPTGQPGIKSSVEGSRSWCIKHQWAAARNLKQCQYFSCLSVQSLHRVNFDLYLHAHTHSLVVFSTVLLYALILNRVILVQYFDSCRVRNEERAGLEGASSYLYVKTWRSIEEKLKTS